MSRPTVHAAHARRELAEKTAHQNLQPEQALNKTSERSISRCITQFIHKTFGAKKISRQWHKLVEKHRMKKKKPYHAEEKAKEKANERMTTFPFMQLPRELRDEVYRHVFHYKHPLSPGNQNVHCHQWKCGTSYVRRSWPLDHLSLLLTSQQANWEASLIFYGEKTFAVEDVDWRITTSSALSEPPPNIHIFPDFLHRYVQYIKYLDFKISVAPISLRHDDRTETAARLDLGEICAWYQDTMTMICSTQPGSFPCLKTLSIQFYEHAASWAQNRCGQVFALEIHIDRYGQPPILRKKHMNDRINIPPYRDVEQVRFIRNLWKGRLLHVEEFMESQSSDPKRHMLLPLTKLKKVSKVVLVQKWQEMEEQIVEKVIEQRMELGPEIAMGKEGAMPIMQVVRQVVRRFVVKEVVKRKVEKYRKLTFGSVNEFLNYAGFDFVNLQYMNTWDLVEELLPFL